MRSSDDLDPILARFRPVGPPPDLRERILGSDAELAQDVVRPFKAAPGANPARTIGEWLPAAAALLLVVLFHWLATTERLLLESSVTSVPPVQHAATGAGGDDLLYEGNPGEALARQDWSPDGRHIIFVRANGGRALTTADLWVLPLSGDKKPYPLVQSPSARKVQAQLSPDGRWLAYATNESRRYQVVVQPFPEVTKGKWQVTVNGGVEPKWRRDGRELFYLAPDDH